MMKKPLFILFLLGLTLISCTEENTEYEIAIDHTFTDDVSPVKTIFTVQEELHWSEWRCGETYQPQVGDRIYNRYEHVFHESGISTVNINASGINGEKYVGDLDIDIPPVADKLVIFGYNFQEDYDFNINDENLIFRFDYYNGTSYTYYRTIVSKSDFENNHALVFDTPISIDISGFETIEGNDLYVYFVIEGEASHHWYYKVNLFIKDQYYNHRLIAPDSIYLHNIIGDGRERIKLISDWTR